MIVLAAASGVALIGLLMIGALAFLVFVALVASAVKAPRFFLAMCGLIALLGFLLVVPWSMRVTPHRPRPDAPTQPPQVIPGEPNDEPVGQAVPDDTKWNDRPGRPAQPDLRMDPTEGLLRAVADNEGVSVEVPGNDSEPQSVDVLQQPAASSSAPAWVGTTGTRAGNVVTEVVEGELYATPDDANNDALEKASRLARAYLAQSLGDKVHGWEVPAAYVNDATIAARFVEPVQRDYGTMYRTHLLMELTPEHRLDLEHLWRHQVVRARIGSAVGGLGLIVLVLATAAGYLKLDDATRGYYSGRLKLAALAVLTGGAATVLAVVRSALG
jgi:hypothetical protein